MANNKPRWCARLGAERTAGRSKLEGPLEAENSARTRWVSLARCDRGSLALIRDFGKQPRQSPPQPALPAPVRGLYLRRSFPKGNYTAVAWHAGSSGSPTTSPKRKLDFTHFKRHKRGNLQYDGTEWRGVSVHRSWWSIVKNPPTPTTSGYAQR